MSQVMEEEIKRWTARRKSAHRAVAGELERLHPAELLLADDLPPSPLWRERRGLQQLPPWRFDAETARRLLTGQFGTRDLGGFGCDHLSVALGAAGAVLQYVQETQRAALPHIRGLSLERRDDAVLLDAASRRNLELEFSLSGNPEHTLAGVVDRTTTPMASRLLRRLAREGKLELRGQRRGSEYIMPTR